MPAEKNALKSNARNSSRASAGATGTSGTAMVASAGQGRGKELTSEQQRLLERQQQLLLRIRNPDMPSSPSQASSKMNPAKTREVAQKVGIWKADGKLSDSYKK